MQNEQEPTPLKTKNSNANTSSSLKKREGKNDITSQFDDTTDKWIQKSVKSIKLEPLLNYPSLTQNKDELVNAHKQGVAYVDTELKEGLKYFKENTRLDEKMHKLDKLLKEAEGKTKIEGPRPIPLPEQVLRGVVCREKKKEIDRLKLVLDNLKQDNYTAMGRFVDAKKILEDKKTMLVETLKTNVDMPLEITNNLPTEELVHLMNELNLKEYD